MNFKIHLKIPFTYSCKQCFSKALDLICHQRKDLPRRWFPSAGAPRSTVCKTLPRKKEMKECTTASPSASQERGTNCKVSLHLKWIIAAEAAGPATSWKVALTWAVWRSSSSRTWYPLLDRSGRYEHWGLFWKIGKFSILRRKLSQFKNVLFLRFSRKSN